MKKIYFAEEDLKMFSSKLISYSQILNNPLLYIVAENQICIIWCVHRNGSILQMTSLRAAKPCNDRKPND